MRGVNPRFPPSQRKLGLSSEWERNPLLLRGGGGKKYWAFAGGVVGEPTSSRRVPGHSREGIGWRCMQCRQPHQRAAQMGSTTSLVAELFDSTCPRRFKRPQQKEPRSGQYHPQGIGTHVVPFQGVARSPALARSQEVSAMMQIVPGIVVAVVALACIWWVLKAV